MGIGRESLFTLTHYEYGEAYFGSYRGMRYRIALEPFKDIHFTSGEEREKVIKESRLKATVWPEPYAYGKTDEALMKSGEFEFSDRGMDEAVDFLNKEYESRIEEWNA